jgi:hypothetical protein
MMELSKTGDFRLGKREACEHARRGGAPTKA